MLSQVYLRFVLAVFFFSAGLPENLIADEDLFRNQVGPILATHCVSCHNNIDPKGDFSLEDSDSFFVGAYVEAGDAKASHLVDLITSADAGERPAMPKNGPTLTNEEVDVIKKWIDAGAKWPDGFVVKQDKTKSFDWWSLKPIKRSTVPPFDDSFAKEWIRTPIDAFILAKLREQKLLPSAEADRRTLIRRLSYDLTGLPPTFEEINAFETDSSPDAYEKLVERYLASPRYGERWARHWLDVVKYADTCGYDKDKLRPNAWPYRDYVIRSLNSDKPYKRFVREQIAGDVLFPNSADGILGLGFIAAGPWDFIGHVEVPESKIDGMVARNLDRDDMVSNTFNTFCSVTVQCARCHDHKFDPISQQHYYGLQAIFAAVDRSERPYDDDPKLAVKRKSLQQKIQRLEKQQAGIADRIEEAGGDALAQLDQQIEQAKANHKQPEFGYHSGIISSADVEKWVEVEFSKPTSFEQIILRPCHDEFAGIGPGFGFPVRYRVEVDGRIAFDQTASDAPNPKLEPVVIKVSAEARKIRVIATKLAERSNDYVFALAELQVLDGKNQNLAFDANVNAGDSTEAPVRWRKTNLVDGIWYEANNDAKTLQLLAQKRKDLVRKRAGQSLLDEQVALTARLRNVETELRELTPAKMVYAATTTFRSEGNFKPTDGKPREIRLLHRGNVETPGDVVAPGFLPISASDQSLMDLKEPLSESQRRAALANWITRDEHPLTWRSIVNRVWHHHFGRGIVDTPNDLGRMGGSPTHPEMLDWLASEFRDGGGSLKDLHRLIVTSSVYRQTSNPRNDSAAKLDQKLPAPTQIDSGNRFLWRMNRRRLSAEEIRDSILLTSGRLSLKMGGPGYYLFALEKTEHSPHFEYHKFDHSDPNSYRRSIYRFIARSQPNPYMTTLDCADSSQSTPTRVETQTPLQSLTMLNSRFNLSMAQAFAERIRENAGSHESQVTLASRLAIGRNPTQRETVLMANYAAKHGLENLGRIVFNLSEFVYVD